MLFYIQFTTASGYKIALTVEGSEKDMQDAIDLFKRVNTKNVEGIDQAGNKYYIFLIPAELLKKAKINTDKYSAKLDRKGRIVLSSEVKENGK